MIKSCTRSRLSPWVTIVEKEVKQPSGAPAVFHSLEIADYVIVLARTSSGRIPIVRQFRPAVEAWTLEFPGGIVDAPELPDIAAIRELREESGLVATNIKHLGSYWSDTGRLSNRAHGYLIEAGQQEPAFCEELDVECRFVTVEELGRLIEANEFLNCIHIAFYHRAKNSQLL